MNGDLEPPGTPHQSSETASNNNRPHSPPPRSVSNISMPETHSGILGTSSNLINSIVGAGIVGIPYAIRNAGFIMGILLLIAVAYFTDKSLRMLVELASFNPKLKNLGVLTYEDLMFIPFGRAGSRFVLVNMFILAYGAMVAYLLIIKDTVPVVLGIVDVNQGNFLQREMVMIVTSLIIIVPLALQRDMASLALTSLLSVLADVILVGFVLIFAPVKSSVSDAGGFGRVIKDNWINGHLFIGLGVLSTAMACQHSAFIVSGSLENKTQERWAMVTSRSITVSALLCIVMGIFGYLGFLENTQGDILNSFNSDSVVSNAGRALLAITMFFTYPMESLVARHVIVQLFYNGDMDGITIDSNGRVLPEARMLGFIGRRHQVTIAIYLMTLVPALIVDDLGPVLSLTGALGASCLAYIGPGLVYLGLNGDTFLEYTAKILEDRGYRSNKNHHGDVQLELPVVGDSQATIQTNQSPISPGSSTKPWWWWVLGFPIWSALASTGMHGTKAFLTALESELGEPIRGASADEDEVVGPCVRDYYISMVLIVFGVIAAVAGVASNIYVEVHGIFYTPT